MLRGGNRANGAHRARPLYAVQTGVLLLSLAAILFAQNPIAHAYSCGGGGCYAQVQWPGGSDGTLTHIVPVYLNCALGGTCNHVTNETWLIQTVSNCSTANNFCWIEAGEVNRSIAVQGGNTDGQGQSYFYAYNDPCSGCWGYHEFFVSHVLAGDYGNASIFSIYNIGGCWFDVTAYDYNSAVAFSTDVYNCLQSSGTGKANLIELGEEVNATSGVQADGTMYFDNYWRGSGNWILQGYNANMTNPVDSPLAGGWILQPQQSTNGGSWTAGCGAC